MSRLRIANVDTVKKNGNLVESAAPDGDVRLYTKATALTDIYARGHFQYVVYGLCCRTMDVVACDDRDNLSRLALRQGRSRTRHDYLVETAFGALQACVGSLSLYADALRLGVLEGSDAKSADEHFLAQHGEEAVALACEA